MSGKPYSKDESAPTARRCKSRGTLYDKRWQCELREGHLGWHQRSVYDEYFSWDGHGQWMGKHFGW